MNELWSTMDSLLILLIVLIGIGALIYAAYRAMKSDWWDTDFDDES